MKKLILLTTIAAALGTSAQAGSWGFSLGNGAGFFWGNQSCGNTYAAPAYVAPAPVYYQRPVVYSAPQTVYMQPYQQMRPTYYPQTVVYRSEPVVIRENHHHCHSKGGNRHNRW